MIFPYFRFERILSHPGHFFAPTHTILLSFDSKVADCEYSRPFSSFDPITSYEPPPLWAQMMMQSLIQVESRLLTLERSMSVTLSHILSQQPPPQQLESPPTSGRCSGDSDSESSFSEEGECSSDDSRSSMSDSRSSHSSRSRSRSPESSPPRNRSSRVPPRRRSSSNPTKKWNSATLPRKSFIVYLTHMKLLPKVDKNRCFRPTGPWTPQRAQELANELMKLNQNHCLHATVVEDQKVILASKFPRYLPDCTPEQFPPAQ
jgi:hypothetical protein